MERQMSSTKPATESQVAKLEGNTPTLRLFALLELIASREQFFTLQGLVEETGIPKPTLHRMLQQLEGAGILQREVDGRQYTTGIRLRQLSENVLLNSSVHAGRHAVLRHLAEQVGESCNLTALSGDEVLYVDRVDTKAPLRFYLHPGSRVPVHCSATGKLFLSQMSAGQRRRLLAHAPLVRYTANTLTDPEALEREIRSVRDAGYGLDREEFLPGLLCIAVLVPRPDGGRSNLSVAVQAPVIRMDEHKAPEILPALRRAADELAAIDAEAVDTDDAGHEAKQHRV
jgi:DNA-binding IclR family transcriptional regulator